MAQALYNLCKGHIAHFSQRLIPDVAYTGRAIQITAICGLHVDLCQMSRGQAYLHSIGVVSDTNLGAGIQAV